jgi:hypothetical protein
MRTSYLRTPAVCLGIGLTLAAVFAAAQPSSSSRPSGASVDRSAVATAAAGSSVNSVPEGAISIDPTVDEYFVPDTTGSGGSGFISADDAYREFADGQVERVPDDTTTQFGKLTMSRGAGRRGGYVVEGAPVWAYTNNQCAPQLGAIPSGQSEGEPLEPSECKQWIFIDAATGELIDLTWTS